MKKILLLLIFIAMSMMSYSQENRFKKLFKEADSAFNAIYSDSLKLNQIFELIECEDEIIEIKKSSLLLMYFNGYLNNYTNSKKEFDFDYLYIELLKNKRAINQINL